MKNRFNRLSSKEWLPFQKSWFVHEDRSDLYRKTLRFFCKSGEFESNVLYHGSHSEIFNDVISIEENIFRVEPNNSKTVHFILIDLLDEITPKTTLQDYLDLRELVINLLTKAYENIDHRRFVNILIPNSINDGIFFPFAWDLAIQISTFLSLKDEKIGCMNESLFELENGYKPSKGTYYSLYFRKDENSSGTYKERKTNLLSNSKQHKNNSLTDQELPMWFILKPKRRNNQEVLHPAKYPEELIEMFVQKFTLENENIFDPMSGTGSSQLGALMCGRNGYGTELSEFFSEIANTRCKEYVDPSQITMFREKVINQFKILNKDAREITSNDFPEIHYLITSPPYWDMLNAKGAENQAKRIEKGLKTNYSDDEQDLGNIEDYYEFIDELSQIYLNIFSNLKPGSYVTIVVKNIKKKGSNYPFAWDLSDKLSEHLTVVPENFWLQDDISIAPFGYGNTWVSNTFHQYCLNFQKPL